MKEIMVATNLSKSIKNKVLVENVSLTINEGEILGLLGPNGAGKSTTIKMMLGLVQPTTGDVIIGGLDVNKNRTEALQMVGAMVEHPNFYEYMSGYKNLKLYANIYNLSDERVVELLKMMDLFEDKDKKVKEYSLGMKQRLGIARAFLNNPKIVILDEPTNGLDPVGVIEIRELIKKLAKEENITFLISSHILGEMQNLCNSVAIINKGKILVKGGLNQLLEESESENLEAYYLKVIEGAKNV